MTLCSLLNASKYYEHTPILESINFSISSLERIAVIGRNGSGKSTLLKLIEGSIELDSGQRVVPKNLKILSLAQNPEFPPNASVEDVIAHSLGVLQEAHERLNHLSIAINANPNDEALLAQYAEVSNFIDEHNGWDLQSLVNEVLERFGLMEFRHRLAVGLSGGEQKRVALCQILLESVDLLILDEPTNHLDVEMVGFLEKFIQNCKFSIVFVSHDRYFIENIATRIIEVENGKLTGFEGGYSSYLRKKEEMVRALTNAHENLLKILKSEEEWLRRGVKARLKRNEGRKRKILELREEAKKNPSIIRKLKLELEREYKRFNAKEGKNTKKCLFEIENLSKELNGKVLIDNFTLRILAGEKIGVVGKNGSGKSTLLKLLLGEIAPSGGVIKRGAIRIGYFDQHLGMLDDSKDLLETFCPNGGNMVDVRGKHIHVYGYLKNFLFPKEFLDKKIGFLSGGEKKRVALALLFTQEVDVLILDEPTNDLDISTMTIIEEYLAHFNGSVIFVSHDRYFVDKLASKLLIFEGEGVVNVSFMSYSEYLDTRLEMRELESLISDNTESKQSQDSNKNTAVIQTKLSYKEKLALDTLPSEIDALEVRIADLESDLANPQKYQARGIATLASELETLKSELDSKLEQYFALEQKAWELQNRN
ncbi:ABC-F family ATP-binding cassette domain-containing protein [uncultured Helicobacter sp.]|uniref:ABC-F family ATP-binding cassette domain-containing protein n=1 Tax=uncultured Helicobacter sp. TaxID=175537 RepID=UPI00374E733C